MQVTDIYSAVDDGKYWRQKVHKNHGFSNAELILESKTTKTAEAASNIITTSKKEHHYKKIINDNRGARVKK